MDRKTAEIINVTQQVTKQDSNFKNAISELKNITHGGRIFINPDECQEISNIIKRLEQLQTQADNLYREYLRG